MWTCRVINVRAIYRNSSVKESRCGSVTDPDSDDDNEEGDYTVYECPGLAPVRVYLLFSL